MRIIIPMAGSGKRFTDAGYETPKPLIEVDGKPMIEHVVELFPGEEKFTFICNSDHLKSTQMRAVIERVAPKGEIVEIAPHKKGPVFSVSHIFDSISDEEVIVNYCDFSVYWDYAGFLNFVRRENAEGAVTAYRGFHPHLLGPNNYAFMRNDGNRMLEIQEKTPFTDNRMGEYASTGTYYFRNGRRMVDYFKRLMADGRQVGGEFYASLPYNYPVADGLKILIYEVEHMLQWGTARDLEEYVEWSNYFRSLAENSDINKISSLNRNCEDEDEDIIEKNLISLMPMAGRGDRFEREGFKFPKPLIAVGNSPMFACAAAALPVAEKNIFVCLAEHLNSFPIEREIKSLYPSAKIVALDRVTEGQALSCASGLEGEDPEAPLLIGACDNGMIWNREKLAALIGDANVDSIIWTFSRSASAARNPQLYGWVETDSEDNALSVSVKAPASSDPFNDHAIVGAFYFRKIRFFLYGLEKLISKNIRVNGEFYVDSLLQELIESGRRVKVFKVDSYAGWGTPDDLRTYEYWRSFFNKCAWHPYYICI